MNRKMIILITSFLMLLSITACGEKKEAVEGTDSSIQEDTSIQESEGFVFESNGDGTCTIKDKGECKDKDIVIPENSPDGDIVTRIEEMAFSNSKDINSIIIENKTIELDDNAFELCEVKNIIIRNCDITIGEYAFGHCDDVEKIEISNSTINLEKYAFYNTGEDASIIITDCSGKIKEDAFQTSGVTSLTIEGCDMELKDNCFSYCEGLVDISISGEKIDIGQYVFYNCTDLKTVSLGEESGDDSTTIMIDTYAFSFSTVEKVFIGKGVIEIDNNAFSYCEDLTQVDIIGTLSKVGSYAFFECPDELIITYDNSSYNKDTIENVN